MTLSESSSGNGAAWHSWFLSHATGLASKIPLPAGMQWCAVRPKYGKGHFEAFQIDKSNDEV